MSWLLSLTLSDTTEQIWGECHVRTIAQSTADSEQASIQQIQGQIHVNTNHIAAESTASLSKYKSQ